MEEPIAVEAEVIEDAQIVAVSLEPAVITADFDGIEAKVRSIMEPYQGITEEGEMSMDIGEAKKCRADLRKIKDELEKGRKGIKAAYNKPLQAFEDRVKAIELLIDGPCNLIDDCVKAQETAIKNERHAMLEESYYAFLDANAVPSFGDNVPFDKIADKKLWNTAAKNWNRIKAEDELLDTVSMVLADWRTLLKIKEHFFDPDGGERQFWATLSLREACQWDDDQRRAQEAVQALHEETGVERDLDEIMDEVEDTYEEKVAWVIHCEMTQRQREKVIAYMKQLGVSGKFRREQ